MHVLSLSCVETLRTKLQSHIRPAAATEHNVSMLLHRQFSHMWLSLLQWFCHQSGHLLHNRVVSSQCCFGVQMAGNVATQLWEEWQSDDVQADVFNVNVPLGFKTVDGTPVKPEVLHTTVDMQSQYSSLYSKLVANRHFVDVLKCFAACMIFRWLSQLHLVTASRLLSLTCKQYGCAAQLEHHVVSNSISTYHACMHKAHYAACVMACARWV